MSTHVTASWKCDGCGTSADIESDGKTVARILQLLTQHEESCGKGGDET